MGGNAVLARLGLPDASEGLWCVRRDRFDAGLAAAAATAGAALVDGVAVADLEIEPCHVTARGHHGPGGRPWSCRASYAIAADGATGVAARRAGLRPRHKPAVALEVQVEHDWLRESDSLAPDVVHLEYGFLRNGYAWAFPKADHVNVGAGVFRGVGDPLAPQLRSRLIAAVTSVTGALGIRADLSGLTMHFSPLPVWAGCSPLNHATGRVLAVGDAACLVNPLFGDGILTAIRSGVLAVECIRDGEATRYTERLHAEIGKELEAADGMARAFYAMPGAFFRMAVRRPSATRTVGRLLSGDTKYTEVAARVMQRVARPLARHASVE
jgi:flavin-dependent dehydrogenase